MVLFLVIGGKLGRVFSLGLLLLLVTVRISRQQAAGVSLRYRGETLPSDSFVDFDDTLNIGGDPAAPTNRNPGTNGAALECITNLENCCGSESDSPVSRAVHGNWYFPGGTRVGEFGGGTRFMVNRGPNEVIGQQQVNGSVRLFRRYSDVRERGRFYCELPNAANVNQTIYVNILNFGLYHDVDHVTFSSFTGSSTTTAGDTGYSLTCSVPLIEPASRPDNVPFPNLRWSFDGSTSLPSGVTATPTLMSSSTPRETYSSTLQFSPLSQAYAGMYTCQLGPGRLVNSVVITVNVPTISVQIATNKAPILGQSDYSLTCNVNGAETLDSFITYQWTKNNGTQTQNLILGNNSNSLTFSSLRSSDAGLYYCNVTVISAYVSTAVHASNNFEVSIIIPEPTVSVHSNSPNPILSGSSPTLTCTVEMKSTVADPLTITMEWTGPDGATIAPATRAEIISYTLYISSSTLDSVESADSGKYTCSVIIENEPKVSINTNISVVDGVFQLKLKSVGICQQWYSEVCDRSEQHSYFIKEALIKAIERRCKCHFPINNLLNEDLFMHEDSQNAIIYRNALLGTHNFNGTMITGFIQDWVSTGPLIKINGNPVRVDSSCPTAISSLEDPVYGEKEEKPSSSCDYNPKYAMCAQHLDDNNIANCFEGCIVRNG